MNERPVCQSCRVRRPAVRRSDSIVFLDFDGVIRIGGYEEGGFKSHFCQEKMLMLSQVLSRTGAQLVVISDWRNASNRDEIEKYLFPHLSKFMHKDWGTPICGHRWNEVQKWLEQHQEVRRYVIIDDFLPHFEGCPVEMSHRLILCNSRFGLVFHQLMEIEYLLRHDEVPCSRGMGRKVFK
jgi:hypothetical protein